MNSNHKCNKTKKGGKMKHKIVYAIIAATIGIIPITKANQEQNNNQAQVERKKEKRANKAKEELKNARILLSDAKDKERAAQQLRYDKQRAYNGLNRNHTNYLPALEELKQAIKNAENATAARIEAEEKVKSLQWAEHE